MTLLLLSFTPPGVLTAGAIASDYLYVSVTFAQGLVRRKSTMAARKDSYPVPFESVFQVDVPKGRDGKHKEIVTRLLREIGQLKPDMAMKIPLDQLPDTKENIRSALSRAASQKHLDIATSSNDEFLYIWKKSPEKS
jgi:hypothetical protein